MVLMQLCKYHCMPMFCSAQESCNLCGTVGHSIQTCKEPASNNDNVWLIKFAVGKSLRKHGEKKTRDDRYHGLQVGCCFICCARSVCDQACQRAAFVCVAHVVTKVAVLAAFTVNLFLCDC